MRRWIGLREGRESEGRIMEEGQLGSGGEM